MVQQDQFLLMEKDHLKSIKFWKKLKANKVDILFNAGNKGIIGCVGSQGTQGVPGLSISDLRKDKVNQILQIIRKKK